MSKSQLANPIEFQFKIGERACSTRDNIVTKMAVYFYLNKISEEQSIIPTLFQLVDDNSEVVSWKVKFLWPNADDGLYKFLEEFAYNVLATAQVLGDFGVSCSPAILNNLEEVKVQDVEQEKMQSISDDARKRGIIILEDYLFEAPESKWPYMATYLEANLYEFRWSRFKERNREEEEDEDNWSKFLEAGLKGTKRAHEENKHSRKQDLSKMACLERPWNEQMSSSSACASSSACISSIGWREVYSLI